MKKIYLYDVGRFIRVLLEDEHGWSVSVDVVLLEQVGRLGQTLVHVAKLHIVLIGKRSQLWRNSSTFARCYTVSRSAAERRVIIFPECNRVYLIQQRNRRHLIKKQNVGFVNVVPALQEVAVIPVCDLRSDPKNIPKGFRIQIRLRLSRNFIKNKKCFFKTLLSIKRCRNF